MMNVVFLVLEWVAGSTGGAVGTRGDNGGQWGQGGIMYFAPFSLNTGLLDLITVALRPIFSRDFEARFGILMKFCVRSP